MHNINELPEIAQDFLKCCKSIDEYWARIDRFMRVHREEAAERKAETDALKARIAFLEAELAKDLKPIFDQQGKAINLMRI